MRSGMAHKLLVGFMRKILLLLYVAIQQH